MKTPFTLNNAIERPFICTTILTVGRSDVFATLIKSGI
jgi:hypothetical protein